MVVRVTDKVVQPVQHGMVRSVLSHGERLMLVEVSLEQGAHVPAHSHPHEQITYVVRGSARFVVGGRAETLAAGESCLIPSGEVHSVDAITASLLIDAFSPPRADFL